MARKARQLIARAARVGGSCSSHPSAIRKPACGNITTRPFTVHSARQKVFVPAVAESQQRPAATGVADHLLPKQIKRFTEGY
jgi:hypothetical protein